MPLMSKIVPRSPYDTQSGLVYFPRMLHKIRLHLAGTLPDDYRENLGQAFDAACCSFLGVSYDDVTAQVKAGLDDAAVFQWCLQHGRKPTEAEIEIWNAYMMKRGWRDVATARLHMRLEEAGAPERKKDILTFFDFIDFDEGRPLHPHP